MSTISNLAPSSSPPHTIAFIATRSTTPLNWSSEPMGSWTTAGVAPRFLMTMSTQL